MSKSILKFVSPFSLICLCVIYKHVHAQDQWILERIAADESRVIFRNTTVTGDFMVCSWLWRDSLAGIWDTRIRVSFKNDSYKGGGFDYKDGYGRELLRVRWYQSAYQNLTWKSIFSNKFPPTPWNLTGHYLSWGYSPISEYSWKFTIDNYTIEPKPTVIPSKLTNPFVPVIEELAVAVRKKRSSNLREFRRRTSENLQGFNIIDLFTGNGIFSQVPQMLINVFSFFSSLFPAGNDDYELPPDDYSTEPEAEVVTPSSGSAASKLVEFTTPMN